jgi:hypothetical protein
MSIEYCWVICPCCHGAKRLEVLHEDSILSVMSSDDKQWYEYPTCCHCQGDGIIPAEVVE